MEIVISNRHAFSRRKFHAGLGSLTCCADLILLFTLQERMDSSLNTNGESKSTRLLIWRARAPEGVKFSFRFGYRLETLH